MEKEDQNCLNCGHNVKACDLGYYENCEWIPDPDNESVSNTLKPCPFCGSKAKLFEQNLGFSIVCQDENLLCNVRLCYCNSEEEALQVWNRRVI